jgi:ATP-binding cassette subfamily C (CFTR/MRP) protein 1
MDEDNSTEARKTDQKAATVAPKGPTQDDLLDLTRRTGDIAVYKYYAKSIGWDYSIMFMAANIAFAFTYSFPREYPSIFPGFGR